MTRPLSENALAALDRLRDTCPELWEWVRDLMVENRVNMHRCEFCGDVRPLDEHGHCSVCVNGMARTKGD